MLALLLGLITMVACDSDTLIQTLVFGVDNTEKESSYFCDCSFSPFRSLLSVTVFKVINQDEDAAVPCSRIFATASPSSRNYARIEIPDTLAVKNIKYSFQFEFSDGSNIFSESWEYSPSKDVFGLCSAVQEKWYENTYTLATCGIVGLLAVGYGTSLWYKSYKKSRTLYVQ